MKWSLGKRLAIVYGTLMAVSLSLLGFLALKGIPGTEIRGWEQILTDQSLSQMLRMADMKALQLAHTIGGQAKTLQSFAQGHALLEPGADVNRLRMVAREFLDNSGFSVIRIVEPHSTIVLVSTLPEEEGLPFPDIRTLEHIHLLEDLALQEVRAGQDSLLLQIAAIHFHPGADQISHIVVGELSPYALFRSVLTVGRELGASGAIDILDSRGKIAASTDQSILWESNIPEIYTVASQGMEGMDTARFDFGQKAVCAFRHINLAPHLGWGLVVRQSQAELKAPILLGTKLTILTVLLAILVSMFVSAGVARRMTRPVRQVTHFAKEIAAGNYQAHTLDKESSEIGELAEAFEDMARNLTTTMEDLKKAKREAEMANQNLQETMRELEHMVDTDRLTGTWNRRYFDSMIERELRRTERYGLPLSLMIFDIDHFKKVNDTFGHDVGDQVLVGITERVKGQIRSSDALIRWGGEEFVLITSSTTLSGAIALAEKIRICVAATEFPVVGTVTISIGVAQFHIGESKREWITRADKLLYAAKHNGRNRVVSNAGSGEAHEPFHLEWNERFQCGNLLIDQEHKELFVYINCMMNAISNPKNGEFHSYFPGLLEALEQHYHDEEKIMSESGFPEMELHKQEHQRLLRYIRDAHTRILNSEMHPVDMMEFLIRQVAVGHMIGYDMQYFPLLRRRKNESDPGHSAPVKE